MPHRHTRRCAASWKPYPITQRVSHGGLLTQAFQKGALQWRPELGHVVPVNVVDDLNPRGADPRLDGFRQVPPAADSSGDEGLPFEQVVARHLALLDLYPALAEFYLAEPDWLETYGLPPPTRGGGRRG